MPVDGSPGSNSAPPFIAGIRERPAPPLKRWRSDLPAAFTDLVDHLLSKDLTARLPAEIAAAQLRALVLS